MKAPVFTHECISLSQILIRMQKKQGIITLFGREWIFYDFESIFEYMFTYSFLRVLYFLALKTEKDKTSRSSYLRYFLSKLTLKQNIFDIFLVALFLLLL